MSLKAKAKEEGRNPSSPKGYASGCAQGLERAVSKPCVEHAVFFETKDEAAADVS